MEDNVTSEAQADPIKAEEEESKTQEIPMEEVQLGQPIPANKEPDLWE
jgi:hypothetical protein